MKKDKFIEEAERIVSRLTEEEKLGLLSTHHSPVKRLGLEEFYVGTEVARGYVGREPERISTVFPQPTGLAATFDRELMKELGRIAGLEARAYYNRDKRGGLMLWGPTVDMVRDPRWGRTEEAYGEDVFLAGELTAAYTLGMADIKEDGSCMTVPTLKHFCANNNENDRGRSDSYLPPRLKYEYYYAAFENAIRCGGARSVMAAYNEINGRPAIMNEELRTLLKEKWGLWFVVSDGGDLSQNVTMHRHTDSMAKAYALSLKAGCDVMTDNEELVKNAAKKALADGLVSTEDIDEALTRVIGARLRLGQCGGSPYDDINTDIIDCEEHRRINKKAALEQVVLLKNDGILPIKNKPRKIAVVGPLANDNLRDWYTGYFTNAVSVYEGIKREFPEADTVYDRLWDIVAVKAPNGKYLSVHEDGTVYADADNIGEAEQFERQSWGEGWENLFSVKYGRYIRLFDDGKLKLHNNVIFDWFTRETFNIRDVEHGCVIEDFQFHRRLTLSENGELSFIKKTAVTFDNCFDIEYVSDADERANKLSDESDLMVCCVGNHPVQTAKECYDRTTLALEYIPFIRNFKNAVLVLISGYPYAITDENETLPAILYTSHAGAELGTCVAETLSGRNCPSGHLPLTWYASDSDLPDILDYDIETAGSTYMYFEGQPLYPFGHGLSYAEFGYGSARAENTADGVFFCVDVTNTSDIGAYETVQVYQTNVSSGIKRPLKKLCGFERVYIGPRETVNVKVFIPRHILAVYDVRRGRMAVEDAEYTFSAGRSSGDLRSSVSLHISGEKQGRRAARFSADSFDSASGVRIFYSEKLGRDTVRCMEWNGTLVYGGLSGGKDVRISVKVSSVFAPKELTLRTGDTELKATAGVRDAYDDFETVSFSLPELPENAEITLGIAEGMSVLEIEAVCAADDAR